MDGNTFMMVLFSIESMCILFLPKVDFESEIIMFMFTGADIIRAPFKSKRNKNSILYTRFVTQFDIFRISLIYELQSFIQ